MTARPVFLTDPALAVQAGIGHGFFTRQGGFSSGLYHALNCGLNSGDDRAIVQSNRALAVAEFGLPADALAAVSQVHSATVVRVDVDWSPSIMPQADGLVTRRRGVALGVLGADCAPVLLADATAGVIGAAHAGWRGAVSGVLDNVVAAMLGLGARPERLVAAVGPCIGASSYEVGPEFPEPFLRHDPASSVFFRPAARPGHALFDLPGYIAARLASLSVGTIAALPCDTLVDEARFFSHRRAQLRGEKASGRLLSLIMLAP